MTASPYCSVIVPSYRSEASIWGCLASLQAQKGAPEFEIIVVDSSPDGTAQIVAQEFPEVRLVHLDKRTDPAAARNIGAHRATGKVLAFLDSDCTANPNWLARLSQALQLGYQAAGGAIANANPESPVSWAGYFCEFREFLPAGSARPVRNLTLGNAAYMRGSFWRAGGFPEGCFPQEDQVFHHRFLQHGFRIFFDPGIIVHHLHRSNMEEFLEHQTRIGRANAGVARQLGLRGAGLVKRPEWTRLAVPALAAYRWTRTLWRVRSVDFGLVFRKPNLAWLCWQGMLAWARGFAEGAAGIAPMDEINHAGSSS